MISLQRSAPRIAIAFKPNSKWKFTASSGLGLKLLISDTCTLSFYNSQVGYSLIGAKELSTQLQQMQQQGLLQPGADITPYVNNPDLKAESSFGSHIVAKFSNEKWNIENGFVSQ